MKKNTIKKALISLSFAFAVSAAALGANALVAKADGETINPAFSTFKLQNGASVRLVNTEYEEDENQYGYSYVMEMSTEQYNAVMSQDSDFTNVRFGMLIGPEAYFDAHPFNNQANIDAYYSLNKEVEGKAFLYDIPSTGFVGDENKVYYRASITEIKDFVRDMRGVAYVQYVYEGTPYKFFFTDESNMRCAVEVADLTIDTLDEETNAAYINTLKSTYINKIDWSVETVAENGRVWTQSWGIYEINPKLSWQTRYNNNRYVNSKYTTTYAYEKEGKEPVAYMGWAGNVAAQIDLEGVWTLTARTNCEFIEPAVAFTKQVTFVKLGSADCDTQTINGVKLSKSATNGVSWVESQNRYQMVDPAYWGYIQPYAEKATGNFIADFELEGGTGVDEFRILANNDEWLAFTSRDGGNSAGNDGIYYYMNVTSGDTKYSDGSAWWTETRLKGNANVFTNPNIRGVGAVKMRVVHFNKTFYLFSNTYWDATNSAVATADAYTLLAVLSTSTVTATSGMTMQVNAAGAVKNALTEFYNVATNDEYGFCIQGKTGEGTSYAYIDIEDDDTAVNNFLVNNASFAEHALTINGEVLNRSNEQHWTKDENGFWNESGSDNTRVKLLDKASGDYMVALKMKTGFEMDFRIYNSATNFVTFMTFKDTNTIFAQSNLSYSTENIFGASSDSTFYTEYATTAAGGDGYLDLLMVRYDNELYVYFCETLVTEGETSTVQTSDNWQLFFKIASDGVTITYGDGIVHEGYRGLGSFISAVAGVMRSNENVFAFRHRNSTQSGKIVVTDDDATVAEFMASEKAVATYAKA